MKPFQLILFAVCWLVAVPSSAWDAVPRQVVPGVYAFVGDTGPRSVANEGMNTTTGFIVTAVGVVVVDSGSSQQVARKIAAAIRACGGARAAFG